MAGKWTKTTEPGIFAQEDARGRKRFKVVFRDAAGKVASRTLPLMRDAKAFKATIVTARREGELPDIAKSRRNLTELWAMTRSTANWRPSTLAWHEDVWARWIAPHFRGKPGAPPGSRAIGSIRRADLETFYLTVPTIPRRRQAQATCSVMFNAAVSHGWLLRSPAKGIPLPDADEREPRYLTAEELAKVAADVPDRYRALVWLLGRTGLRVGEALALRVKNANGSIRVVENQSEVGGRKYVGRPKSRDGKRIVPLSANVHELVRHHITTYGNVFDPESLVFTNAHGGSVSQAWFRREVFQPACQRAGVLDSDGKPPTVHDLRHTAISLMLRGGMQPFEVAKVVGHADTKMIEERYGHLYESHVQEKVDALDGMFAP
jgi:integrase